MKTLFFISVLFVTITIHCQSLTINSGQAANTSNFSNLSAVASISANAKYTTFTDWATNPPDFAKLSFQEANAAVTADVRKQISPEYITDLVNEIRHADLNPTNKVLAIYLLGVFHPNDTNAIDVLIENIDLKATYQDFNLDVARWGIYPAQEALMKIGVPTVNPIIAHLFVETNKHRRQLLCEVLKKVEGQKIAQKQIRHKLTDEPDLYKQANLGMALKELE